MNSIAAITLVIQLTNLSGASDVVVRDAQSEVVTILNDIGIATEWAAPSDRSISSRRDVMHVNLVPYEAGSLTRAPHQVLGAATRTGLGTPIALVFYQRVRQEADAYAVPPARVLACAIAHEIGHLLQTTPSHDSDGLMRGVWTRADFARLSAGRLRFLGNGGNGATVSTRSHRDIYERAVVV